MPTPYKYPKQKIGDRFSRLTLEALAVAKSPNGMIHRYRCDCGNTVNVLGYYAASGHTKSCGCYQRERSTTHGDRGSPTYMIWAYMHQRCKNPNNTNYHLYGGRGIKVCARWASYEAFLEDMGERPAGLSLDRIDTNGNYEPTNCRWATASEQCNNRRVCIYIEYQGQRRTMAEWSKATGINRNTIKHRLHLGLPPEQIFTKRHLKHKNKDLAALRQKVEGGGG